MDMNVERAEDVVMHKKLLHMARASATRSAVEVRLVQVIWFYIFSDKFHACLLSSMEVGML